MQQEPGVWVEGPDGELIPDYEKQGYRVTSIRQSSSAAFKRVIRIVHMEKPLQVARAVKADSTAGR